MSTYRKPKTQESKDSTYSKPGVSMYFGDVTLDEHLKEHTYVITNMSLLTEALALNRIFDLSQPAGVLLEKVLEAQRELNKALDVTVDLDPCGFNMDQFLTSPAGTIPAEFRAKERQDSLGLTPTPPSAFEKELAMLVDRLDETAAADQAAYMMGHEERDYDDFYDDPDQDPNTYRGEL